MRNLLQEFGFDSIQELCGPDATRDKIISEWEGLINVCNEGDAVAIYYSGHGGMVERPESHAEIDDTSPLHIRYLVPSQFDNDFAEWGGIFEDELSHYLFQTTCRTQNVTYILDCCHSARLGREPTQLETRCKAHPADKTAYKKILHFKRRTKHQLVDKSWSNPSVVRLSAASESDAAFQYNTGSDGWRGIMTRHLILSLRAANRGSMSWRNIMVEVAARVRHLEAYDPKSQEPRSAGADTRIPFAMEKDRTKVFSAIITQNGGSKGAEIRSGRIHGITLGCTFDLIPINHDSGVQPMRHQSAQGETSTTPRDKFTTEVKIVRLKTFFCTATASDPRVEIPFEKGTLVLARQRPRTESNYKILIAPDVDRLKSLRSAIAKRRGLTISKKEERYDLRIQPGRGDSNKIKVQGGFDDEPRRFTQLVKRDAIGEGTDNVLLFASRLDSAKSLLELRKGQDRDELLPAEFYMEIRKVNLDRNKEYETLAILLVIVESVAWKVTDTVSSDSMSDASSTNLDKLSFAANDETELVLEGWMDQHHYASVFRVDAAGNIILASLPYEDGVYIHSQAGRTRLNRGDEGHKKRGMLLSWPPGVPAFQAVRESFVVVVTNGQADLRSLETAAARDYYDKLARAGGDKRVALLSSVDKFKMVRIDYKLRPPPTEQDDTHPRMTVEESRKYLEDSRWMSPEDTDECKDIESSLIPIIGAERGVRDGFRRMFKDVPPFVWVINAHSEEITVTVARESPTRYLKQLELQAGMTSGGASIELEVSDSTSLPLLFGSFFIITRTKSPVSRTWVLQEALGALQ